MVPLQASPPALASETAKYRLFRERVLTECPDLDEATLADTLEGITDLNAMVAAVIRSALLDQALAVGLKSRIDDLRARLDRLQLRAEKKRELALGAMESAGLKKLVESDFTASTRASPPALIVTSEGDIPAEFWIAQAPRLDRQGIVASLKRGVVVPGTVLSNPHPVLSVRTK